jgi:hypothetical protein
MSSLTTSASPRSRSAHRAQILAEALISAYINDIS